MGTPLGKSGDVKYRYKDNQIMLDFIHYMNLDEKYQHFKEHAKEISDPDMPFTKFTL